jgi:hypothetical protein
MYVCMYDLYVLVYVDTYVLSINFAGQGEFEAFLDDPKLLAWFAQNTDLSHHPKLHPIPIGIPTSACSPSIALCILHTF